MSQPAPVASDEQAPNGQDGPRPGEVPLLVDTATGEPVRDAQGNRLAVLQFIVPEPMLAAIGALCVAAGCLGPDGIPAPGELVNRALRLVGLLAERKQRGDERVTVLWNQGMPQPSGILLAQAGAIPGRLS